MRVHYMNVVGRAVNTYVIKCLIHIHNIKKIQKEAVASTPHNIEPPHNITNTQRSRSRRCPSPKRWFTCVLLSVHAPQQIVLYSTHLCILSYRNSIIQKFHSIHAIVVLCSLCVVSRNIWLRTQHTTKERITAQRYPWAREPRSKDTHVTPQSNGDGDGGGGSSSSSDVGDQSAQNQQPVNHFVIKQNSILFVMHNRRPFTLFKRTINHNLLLARALV